MTEKNWQAKMPCRFILDTTQEIKPSPKVTLSHLPHVEMLATLVRNDPNYSYYKKSTSSNHLHTRPLGLEVDLTVCHRQFSHNAPLTHLLQVCAGLSVKNLLIHLLSCMKRNSAWQNTERQQTECQMIIHRV